MILLAVSTSSPRGTVAVARHGEILSRVAYDGGTSHAERLFAVIEQALGAAGVAKGELDALACDVGPGSFTGVRVGVATCQGIALGLDRPVIGIGSLEAMAYAARRALGPSPILSLLDAKKEEVFAAVHDPHGAPLWGPLHLPIADVDTLRGVVARFGASVRGSLAQRLAVFGAGVDGAVDPDDVDLPDAAAIAVIAAHRLDGAGDARHADPSALEPHYVRPPDAKPMAEQGSPATSRSGAHGPPSLPVPGASRPQDE